jgi:hypothetical protein
MGFFYVFIQNDPLLVSYMLYTEQVGVKSSLYQAMTPIINKWRDFKDTFLTEWT